MGEDAALRLRALLRLEPGPLGTRPKNRLKTVLSALLRGSDTKALPDAPLPGKNSRAKKGAAVRRPRAGRHQPCSPVRYAAASEAFDAAVKIAFLSSFMMESQEARYCA